MHNPLKLNGKVYISSRQAAKIVGYATDYIGQLCRSGKLECTRVGRVWYVTEESVAKHKQFADQSLSIQYKIQENTPPGEIPDHAPIYGGLESSSDEPKVSSSFSKSPTSRENANTHSHALAYSSETADLLPALAKKNPSTVPVLKHKHFTNKFSQVALTSVMIVSLVFGVFTYANDELSQDSFSHGAIAALAALFTGHTQHKVSAGGTGLSASVGELALQQDTSGVSAQQSASSSNPVQNLPKNPSSPSITVPSIQTIIEKIIPESNKASSNTVSVASSPSGSPSQSAVLSDVTVANLEQQIQNLDAKFQSELSSQLASLSSGGSFTGAASSNNFDANVSSAPVVQSNPIDNVYQEIAESQNISQLSGTTITNPTINNGSISGASISGGSISTNALTASSAAISGSLTATGNIGIGTTSPWATLSVTGNSDLGNSALAGYFNATSTAGLSTFAGTVGIGTTTTTAFLTIQQQLNPSPLSPLLPNSPGLDMWSGARNLVMYAQDPNIGGGEIGMTGGYGLNFITANTVRLSIRSGGNVGIGTTSPYAPLSVSGQVVASYFTATTTTPSTFAGNIGIGTTTPGTTLSVNGVGNFASAASTLYSPLFAPFFDATSTTATSTFSGAVSINNLITSGTPVIDVRAYGAKCNGVTDDTAAIQAAFTAAPNNSVVYFPATGKSCMVSGTVELENKTNVSIVGQSGSELQVMTGGTQKFLLELLFATSTRVTGMTFMGDPTLFSSSTSQLTGDLIYGRVLDGVTIDHNVFQNYSFAGVLMNDTIQDSLIEGNNFIGPGSSYIKTGDNGNFGIYYGTGINGGNVPDNNEKIEDNSISNSAIGIFSSAYVTGFDIGNNTIHDILGQHGIYSYSGAHIHGNTIYNLFGGGNGIVMRIDGDNTSDINNVDIEDNYIDMQGNTCVPNANPGWICGNVGIAFTTSNITDGNATHNFNNAIVSDNSIKGGGEGISVQDSVPTLANSSYNWLINGNLISSTTPSTAPYGEPIGIEFSGSGKISNNTIDSSYYDAIQLNTSSSTQPTEVENNTITNPYTASFNSQIPGTIFVGYSSSTAYIENNLIQSGNGTYSIYGSTNAPIYESENTYTQPTSIADPVYLKKSFSNGTLQYNSATGNIGIGTTSPWATLSVTGNSDLGNSALAGYFNATSTAGLSTFAGTVGIGTTTTTAFLTIQQQLNPSPLSPLLPNSPGLDMWSGARNLVMYAQDPNIGGGEIGMTGGYGLNFITANTVRLSIRSGGNVGIGTTSPYAPLSVSGQVVASYFTATTTTPSTFAGNIGIGTTTPWRTLSVNGNSDLGNSALAGYFTATSSTASTFAGNIGIGTTNPQRTLDMAAGDTYGYNGVTIADASTTLDNFFFGGSGNLSMTGAYNTASGWITLSAVTTGNSDSAFGYNTMPHLNSGVYDTAMGFQSLNKTTSGSNNTAVGIDSLYNNTTAGNNTGSGFEAGFTLNGGGNDTFLGYGADVASAASTTLTNATAVGYDAIVGASNSMALGGTGANEESVGIGTSTPWRSLSVVGTASIVGLTTESGTNASALCLSASNEIVVNTGVQTCTISSEEYKHDIEPLSPASGLAIVDELIPSSFIYNADPADATNWGFIAGQLASTSPELAEYGANGQPASINEPGLLAVATLAIQAQQTEINSLSSATSSPLLQSQSFMGAMAEAILSYLNSIGGWVFDQIKATVGIFSTDVQTPRIDTGTAAVTNGIEMTDSATGEIYCVRVTDGSLEQTAGSCENDGGGDGSSASSGNEADSDSSSSSANSSNSQTGGPVISINGDNPAQVPLGSTYSDLGARITGPTADLNLGITTTGTVDTSTVGTYTIVYSATDQAGLSATSTRTVNVYDPNAEQDSAQNQIASSTPDTEASSTPDSTPSTSSDTFSSDVATSTATSTP